jgi:hypothetical protein
MARSHDHAQTAAAPIFLVPNDQIQRDSIPGDPTQKISAQIRLFPSIVDDPRPDVHPRWRRFCPHAEHTLPPDEKSHRLPHALPH